MGEGSQKISAGVHCYGFYIDGVTEEEMSTPSPSHSAGRNLKSFIKSLKEFMKELENTIVAMNKRISHPDCKLLVRKVLTKSVVFYYFLFLAMIGSNELTSHQLMCRVSRKES